MACGRKKADEKYERKRRDDRARAWAFLVYEESVAESWRETVESWHVRAFASPLHDKDAWSEADEREDPEHKAGEPKKPHRHVMVMFPGLKSRDEVDSLSASVGGTRAVRVHDSKAYARYLCHLDSPEKSPYDPADVLSFAGASYQAAIEDSADATSAIAEMEEWLEQHDVTGYAVLSKYARENRMDWYSVLVKDGRHLFAVMRSREWEKEKKRRRQAEADALSLFLDE